MSHRTTTVLSVLIAAMLVSIAGLHASGIGYVAAAVAGSELPEFLKRVLPPLYLYPSILLLVLAAVVIFSLWHPRGRSFALYTVSAMVALNAALGFILGGIVPGGVLLLVAVLALLVARMPLGEAHAKAD